MQFTAEIIAQFLGGRIEGDPSTMVSTVAKIEEAAADALVFLSNPKYEHFLYTTKAGIAIINEDLELREAVSTTLIRVENAYASFAKLLELYAQSMPRKSGIRSLASVHESAQVGEDCYVGEYAVVDEGVTIGSGCQIFPHVYIGDGAVVGDNCTIHSGVKIYQGCVIGRNVVLHSGVVVGGDGFGFAPNEDGTYHKIPQIGNVVIEDDVEIGANTCVDRATMGSTVVGRGVKLDNMIQLGHNVTVGHDTVIAAQTGVAGSTKIGSNAIIGGQVGFAGHITVVDGTIIGSQSGVTNSVKKQGEVLFGTPAINSTMSHRISLLSRRLPDMQRQLQQLTRQMKELTSGE
ncbi:MAG: UDP-3-O-(3-hydroxymyristoyl)glucosamine N-acyltransferase [Rikenellaceae bacterium]